MKGVASGWTLFTEGLAAQNGLNWDLALQKYRNCDADADFIDPICLVSAAQVELTQTSYKAAKSDVDAALSRSPNNHAALTLGIFINLKVGDVAEADRLHEVLAATAQGIDNSTDCLYYYGRNQHLLATTHCEAAVRQDQSTYTAWSNAGYVALDNGDFQSAVSYFAKAIQLFYDSKNKHTVTEEVDLWWGVILAQYNAGDRKKAEKSYRALKKQYPNFVTMAALNQLPLVWSDRTTALVNEATADFR